MTVQTRKKLNRVKLNQLEQALPEGLLVDASWLEQHGYYRSLRSQYAASGWLEQPAHGVFRRPRGKLSWEQVVVSLQSLLQFPVSVGGRSALDLQGYAHYLLHSQKAIHLYSDKKLPGWVNKLPLEQKLIRHNRGRFLPALKDMPVLSLTAPTPEDNEIALPGALRFMPWGHWQWPLVISTPERAILELIDELPNDETFDLVDVTMEGLVNLSPRRMQLLLEQATSVKVKRLFFFFADRHQHSWLSHIKRNRIDLGKGKRMLVEGGKLDSTYQITVPEEFHGIQ